jgi:hypothetical protein
MSTLTQEKLSRFVNTVSSQEQSLCSEPDLPFDFTPTVAYLVREGEASWLLKAIANWQVDKKVKEDESLNNCQFWTLQVNPDRSATLILERGEGGVILTQEIEHTNFYLEKLRFYLLGGELGLLDEY